ncbi:hypothetical protein IPdc08_00459 [archaeon]|nr:hypothetical protein IPdc08_00459 [archaeon]
MQKLLVELNNTPEVSPKSLLCKWNIKQRQKLPCIVLANNSSKEDLRSGKSGQALSVAVINMHKKPIPDSARNSEQVEIPAGIDWIKNYYSYTNFKICEVGQFLHQLKWVVSLPRLL